MTCALLAAAVTVLAALGPPPAHAAAEPGLLLGCEFVATGSPVDDHQVGYLGGAAVSLTDGTDLRSGRVTCTVHDGFTHADPAVVAVSSGTMSGVAVAPYETVDYVQPPERYYVACLSVEVDGAGTFYWDEEADDWSRDPDVLCIVLWDDGRSIVDDAYDAANALAAQYVDPPLCAVLAAHPTGPGPARIAPDGDVYVTDQWVWDCPPYEPS